jgi:hypothetical protein
MVGVTLSSPRPTWLEPETVITGSRERPAALACPQGSSTIERSSENDPDSADPLGFSPLAPAFEYDAAAHLGRGRASQSRGAPRRSTAEELFSMRPLHRIAIAIAGCLVFCSSAAQATFFQNSTGLASPAVTITFSEHILTPGDILTNQYADLGVTFSNQLFWSPIPGGPPHIDDYNITNFLPNQNAFQGQIDFAQPVTGAAFAVAGNPGTLYISAFYQNVLVESGSILLDDSSQTNNFIGFTDIVFDRINLIPAGSPTPAMVMDNLQVVPEPGSGLLVLVGVTGLALKRRA